MHMFYKMISLITKPFGGYALLCIYIYVWLHDHDYVMDFSIFMVILRSTMGPYKRPMIEVAYGEILFSLHRGCMGDDSLGRVVRVSTWCRLWWTYPGQHQCGHNEYYFLVFKYIRTYIYVYCFQNLYAI